MTGNSMKAKLIKLGFPVLRKEPTGSGERVILENGVHVHISIKGKIYLQGSLHHQPLVGKKLGLPEFKQVVLIEERKQQVVEPLTDNKGVQNV